MKAALAPVVFPESKILILGTMPGEQSLLRQEYYGNRGNHFWKLMFTVFEEPLSDDYTVRLNLLKKHRIALWDVLAGCEREGSLDSKIRNEVPNDFDAFHRKHPGITHVFFSSKAAAFYYDRYAVRNANIHYAVLPSPSGANAGKTFLEKLVVWKTLAEIVRAQY